MKSSNKNDTCAVDIVHDDIVSKVRAAMPDEDTLYDVSELFKVFGDSTRTNILSALHISEMCVCDLAKLLGMTKSAVSHQLRVLRQTKLVRYRKSGKEVIYSLDDSHVAEIMKIAIEHVNE